MQRAPISTAVQSMGLPSIHTHGQMGGNGNEAAWLSRSLIAQHTQEVAAGLAALLLLSQHSLIPGRHSDVCSQAGSEEGGFADRGKAALKGRAEPAAPRWNVERKQRQHSVSWGWRGREPYCSQHPPRGDRGACFNGEEP